MNLKPRKCKHLFYFFVENLVYLKKILDSIKLIKISMNILYKLDVNCILNDLINIL